MKSDKKNTNDRENNNNDNMENNPKDENNQNTDTQKDTTKQEKKTIKKETENKNNNDKTKKMTNKEKFLYDKLKKSEEDSLKVKELCKQLIEKQQKLQVAVANERRHLEFKLKSQQDRKLNQFIEEIIGTINNFDIAIKIAEENKNIQSGIMMIKKQFLSLLKNYDVYEITAEIGEQFDSTKHEAIEQVKGTKEQYGTISEVVSNGFIRNSNGSDKFDDKSVILKIITVKMFN